LINQTPTTNQTLQSKIPVKKQWIMMKTPGQTLGRIIRHFKAKSSKEIRDKGLNYFQWQRNYFERIIRNEKELLKIREYIRNNPLQWYIDKENPANR
jgi:REP element-mobilizing transposase RayT